jgi:single-strand DNA-binding protein
MANINRVVLAGNLTRDPELRQLAGGNSVCKLRIAVNTRAKDRDTGQWTDKPNYFDVTVWGAQGESCARYLTKGSGVMVDGRLEWREWEQEGQKRQAVEIIAENTQFVGGRGEGASPYDRGSDDFTPAPARTPAAVPAADDDDIPF